MSIGVFTHQKLRVNELSFSYPSHNSNIYFNECFYICESGDIATCWGGGVKGRTCLTIVRWSVRGLLAPSKRERGEGGNGMSSKISKPWKFCDFFFEILEFL